MGGGQRRRRLRLLAAGERRAFLPHIAATTSDLMQVGPGTLLRRRPLSPRALLPLASLIGSSLEIYLLRGGTPAVPTANATAAPARGAAAASPGEAGAGSTPFGHHGHHIIACRRGPGRCSGEAARSTPSAPLLSFFPGGSDEHGLSPGRTRGDRHHLRRVRVQPRSPPHISPGASTAMEMDEALSVATAAEQPAPPDANIEGDLRMAAAYASLEGLPEKQRAEVLSRSRVQGSVKGKIIAAL